MALPPGPGMWRSECPSGRSCGWPKATGQANVRQMCHADVAQVQSWRRGTGRDEVGLDTLAA